MRKLICIAGILSIMVGACKKDEPAPPSLEGTWKQTSTTIEGCTDSGLNQPETTCTDCVTIVLSVSNNVNLYTATLASGTSTGGTWSPGGPYTNPTGYISFAQSGTSGSSGGTYVMTATTLTISVEAGFPGPGCKIIQKYTRQ